jgi:hypothetical protein
MNETVQWEYRAETLGSVLRGIKDEEIEEVLNIWGAEGWEVIAIHSTSNSSKITAVAKRLLSPEVKRQRRLDQRGW